MTHRTLSLCVLVSILSTFAQTFASAGVTEQWVTANIPVLNQPLENRLPVLIWGNPIQSETSDFDYVQNLYRRGLCYTPNIITDRTSDAARKLQALQAIGGYRPMIMQSCGQVTFNIAPHVNSSDPAFPCLGFYRDKKADAATYTTSLLADVVNLGMSPNLFIFDWENWCRYQYKIDNPDSNANLTDQLAHARTCVRCAANLDPQDLSSNQAYLNAIEAKRAQVLKDGLYAPVKAVFPEALFGNYWTTSFVRSDQPLGNVGLAVGWHGSGAKMSMHVGYGNRYDKLKNRELVGWNTFRYFLQLYSESTREAVGDEIQIPWTCRLLPADVMEDENGVKHKLFAKNGTEIPLYAWPRSSYREYLRHCMLRGAKSFAVFYPQSETSDYVQSLGYQRELSDVLQVVNEMHAYDDVLDTGTILNKSDMPGAYDSSTGAVVWSGVATADKAVIRAVSFTGAAVAVPVPVFGRTETVTATVQGTTTIIHRFGSGETVVFSDEFADNSHNWTNVGATATIGTDPGATGQSVWHPTTAATGTVGSTVTLPTNIDIAQGPIAVYFRVRADQVNGGPNSRFDIFLHENTSTLDGGGNNSNGFGEWGLIPGGGVSVLRRGIASGSATVTNITSIGSFPNTSTYWDFRLILTDNHNGSATLEAFQYNTTTNQYVSRGSITDMDLDSGLFNQLTVQNNNTDADGRVYFDSVQIRSSSP